MNGVIVVNKPSGKTSFWVVNKIGKLLRKTKVGHTGTLDPLATGVLPVCIGEATKLASFIMEGNKEYEVTARLGERTDSLDADGAVTEKGKRSIKEVTEEEIKRELARFCGNIVQIPPMYSAVRHEGKKLYELARKGENVKRKERIISITDIEFRAFSPPYVSFRVECSKGTYVRSLVDSLGEALGTMAHVSDLKRTRSSIFTCDDAVEIGSISGLQDIEKKLMSMEEVISRLMPVIEVDEGMAKRIANGYQLNFQELKKRFNILQELPENRMFAIFSRSENTENKPVVLAISKMLVENYTDMLSFTSDNKILKTVRVFNYSKFLGQNK
jgi:tRNA pseudouridine55 synthase